jgi:hypothetical protein
VLDHPPSSLRQSFGGLAPKPGEASGADGSRMMTSVRNYALRNCKNTGLTVPQTLLARADTVIE